MPKLPDTDEIEPLGKSSTAIVAAALDNVKVDDSLCDTLLVIALIALVVVVAVVLSVMTIVSLSLTNDPRIA